MHKLLVIFFLLISFIAYSQKSYKKEGKASYYADKFEGKSTASGEPYKHKLKTAAHKTLAFGTMVKVTNLKNGKSVVVKINDRGPFVKGRIIDLSKSAAQKIDGIRDGIMDVSIKVISRKK